MAQQRDIETIRHSTAHLLAQAVIELWPKTQLGIGPAIEHGFYYDFDIRDDKGDSVRISPDDLAKIEERMHKIIARDEPFRREEMNIADAVSYFNGHNQNFKSELLHDLQEKGTTAVNAEEQQDVSEKPETASLYWTGEYFVDLCRGPHVDSTATLGIFKLTKIAGAYWRGSEDNAQLQRIYGIAFATQEELDAYLAMLEEAEKRDHRKLGQELDLFTFSPLVGAGLPLFTPRGQVIREELQQFVYSLERPHGYQRVRIPHITKKELYETSGHWQKFQNELFKITSREGHELAIKPMNCPHHTQIYSSRKRSYRELPIRYKEVTEVYRDEQTGELSGLGRVRMITQDDAHVFCRMVHIEDECLKIWDIVDHFYAKFAMPVSVRFSRHDPAKMDNYLGTPEVWARAEEQLKAVIVQRGVEFIDGPGEAAMYGPKIDFMAKDAIGRVWQLATIQLDFNLPERFDLSCVNEQGEDERIVMIHRAILGSVERFMAVLIEHYAGAFPVWLAPVQVAVIPVAEDHDAAAAEFAERIRVESNARVDLIAATESVGKRIRATEQQKVPYMIVFGDKEAAGEALQVRRYGQEEQLKEDAATFIERLRTDITDRR
ncbi:MAG: threonine--tRNA ligase [Candidatus Uhrbacteria bacterium]